MRYRQVPKGLLEEPRAMVRLYLFLRHECELRFADELSPKELKHILDAIKPKKNPKSFSPNCPKLLYN